jgi:3-deoxy-D-manno-octulosonic-acid transferase
VPLQLTSYRLLLIVLSPVLLGHILWLAIKHRQSRYFWQRIGFDYASLPTGSLWFHCASVGEVNTLLALLKNLHARNQQLKFIITTNTITGGNTVSRQNLDYLHHCYLPFDWCNGIRRFLSATRPAALYVMETEIWPNLFQACHKKNIPVFLLNARLSSKTTTANRWVKSLLKISLANVTAIYARSDNDADAYRQLGANSETIKTIGNLKFTTAMMAGQPGNINSNKNADENSLSIYRDYVLLASTHQDEERQFYGIWKQLDRDELLVIAPRHPERAASIINQLNCKDIAVRSKNEQVTDLTKVFLLDTIGELNALFIKAKLVIMGGSFVPVGGHNILEPAAFNRAIITGPYMENFAQELQLMLDKKAIIQLAAIDELAEKLSELLDDESYRTTLQHNTENLSHDVEGILESYTDLIAPELIAADL